MCADARTGHGGLPGDPLVVGLVLRALAVAPLEAAPAARASAPPCGPTARGPSAADRPGQLVMSRVVKFAHAAPSSTTTYPVCTRTPEVRSPHGTGSRKRSTQASQ